MRGWRNSIDQYRCCYKVGDYQVLLENGKTPEEALEFLTPRSRDNARTPYQWNRELNAGFSSGTPWIGINPNYTIPAPLCKRDFVGLSKLFRR